MRLRAREAEERPREREREMWSERLSEESVSTRKELIGQVRRLRITTGLGRVEAIGDECCLGRMVGRRRDRSGPKKG